MSSVARFSAFSRGEEEIVEFLGYKFKLKPNQKIFVWVKRIKAKHNTATGLPVNSQLQLPWGTPHTAPLPTLASSHFFAAHPPTSSHSLGAFVLPKQRSRQPPLPTVGFLINKFVLPWMPSQGLILAYWQPCFKGKCKPNSFKLSALMTPGILDQDTREWTLALSFRQVTRALNLLCKIGAHFYWSRRATSYKS